MVTWARTAVAMLLFRLGGPPLTVMESRRPPLSTVKIVFLPFGLPRSTSKYGMSSVDPEVSLTAVNGSGVIGVVTICAPADPARSTAAMHRVANHCVFFRSSMFMYDSFPFARGLLERLDC